MPRLTFANYCVRYKLLRKTWEESPEILAHLLPNEQWDLFDYFKLHEARSENELRVHWAEMRSQGSMPQRAGRTYRQFTRALARVLERRTAVPVQLTKGKYGYEVKVYGQVQSEIDIEGLAQVVIMLARQMQKEAQSEHAT